MDAFNRVLGMAQATRWVSPSDDLFSTPANSSELYWMCLPYHQFSSFALNIRQERLQRNVVGIEWTQREWWKPLMETVLEGYHLPRPETQARSYQDIYLTPLPQRDWSMVALYVDPGLAEENRAAINCQVGSVLAPAAPNPNMEDKTGET